MYKSRLLEAKLLQLFQHFPVVAVIGARQVGKTTLIEHLNIPNLKSVVLDAVQDTAGAKSDPQLFLDNYRAPLFIDEFQYAPQLTAAIKKSVDRAKKPGLYLLSGSQQFNVIQELGDSLAGRVAIVNLLPMSVGEKHSFSSDNLKDILSGKVATDQVNPFAGTLSEQVWKGGFPRTLDFPNELFGDFFHSYVTTYIERDIRHLSLVKDAELFGRFVSLLAAQSSMEINDNHIGRELGVARNTALSWRQLLELSFQWTSLPVFSKNSIKAITKKKKGHFCDTGLMCSLLRLASPEAILGHPSAGQLFETFVFNELRKVSSHWGTRPKFSHFRTNSGSEVDLILEYNGAVIPIEIKLTSNPSKKMIRGLQTFREAYPKENIPLSLIICATEKPFQIKEDVWAIPWWMIY